MSAAGAPHALLLVAPGCPHCGAVLEGLVALVKEAVIGRLTVVNIAAEPEEARRLGVRSVPWTRLGDFDLPGLLTPAELKDWAGASGSEAGRARYLSGLLREGRRAEVEARTREDPRWLGALVALLADPETGIHVRLGLMATLEELKGSDRLAGLVDRLGRIACEGEARIRVDALHALSMTAGPGATPYVRACLQDENADVREAAQDALEVLVRIPAQRVEK